MPVLESWPLPSSTKTLKKNQRFHGEPPFPPPEYPPPIPFQPQSPLSKAPPKSPYEPVFKAIPQPIPFQPQSPLSKAPKSPYEPPRPKGPPPPYQVPPKAPPAILAPNYPMTLPIQSRSWDGPPLQQPTPLKFTDYEWDDSIWNWSSKWSLAASFVIFVPSDIVSPKRTIFPAGNSAVHTHCARPNISVSFPSTRCATRCVCIFAFTVSW